MDVEGVEVKGGGGEGGGGGWWGWGRGNVESAIDLRVHMTRRHVHASAGHVWSVGEEVKGQGPVYTLHAGPPER